MAQEDQWWAQDAVVKQGETPAPRGVEIAPQGVTPIQQAAEARAQAGEVRANAAAQRSASAEQREQAKFELEQSGVGGKPTEAQQKTLTLLTRIAGGARDIQSVVSRDEGAQAPGLGETLARNVVGEGLITRNIAGGDRRVVTDAQRDMLDALLTLGTGAAYNREQLEGQTLSYFPQYGDTESEITVKNNRLNRLIEAARIASGPMAAKFDESIAPLIGAPDAAAPAPKAGELQVAQGETYSTDADFEEARKLNEAWRGGATIDQIKGMMAPGHTLSPDDEARLNADKNRELPFAPGSSGRREGGQQISGIGGAIASTAAGAVSGYSANMAEEIAGLIPGADPEQVKAAFRAYEAANPNAFAVGEIGGGIYSPVNKVAPGAGVGRMAAQGAVYGGIYGAGEETPGSSVTEQFAGPQTGMTGRAIRAAEGVGLGALGGYVGGKLANRFLPGGGTPQGVAAGMDNIAQGIVPPAGPAGLAEAAIPSPAVLGSTGQVALPIAQSVTQSATQAMPAEDLGKMISLASGTGGKASAARVKLAEMAQVNPEAMAAAERLGIEVPPDVFADNAQIREAIGMTRAVAGSDASAIWRDAVSGAVDQADSVMRDFDAAFIEGSVAPGAVSQRVKQSLTATRESMNRTATGIYEEIDAAVPKQTPVQLDNLFTTLTDIASEVGEQGMSGAERKLLNLIQTGDVGGGADITYGRLIREKNLIGKALRREESPFGSLDESTLKRLYSALAQDQLDNVGRIGGEEMRKQLRGANLIYAKERALGKRIVTAFGEDLEGGIAGVMRSAMSEAARGDPGQFTRLLKAVPDDLKRDVVATALASATRSTRGAERGGFGFSEFASLYPKLRANPPVYKQIVETLGKDASDTLRDLYVVSKRITDARANVPTTGKANQGILQGMKAEGIVRNIMGSSAGQRVATAAIGMGGPVTSAFAPDLISMMTAKPNVMAAAGKLFTSDEFAGLLTDAATKDIVPEKTLGRVATSPTFHKFANALGLPRNPQQRIEWLRRATVATSGQARPGYEKPANAITPVGAQ